MQKQIILQWINRISNETGYVKAIKQKERCFINTFNRDEARTFLNRTIAEQAIQILREYGEAEQNRFVICEREENKGHDA